MVQWLVTLFLRNFYYPNFASFLPLPTPFRRKVSRSPDWSYTSDPSDSTSQSAGITGVRYFRPPARSAYGLTAGRPWTCAETLHQDNWDVGRAGDPATPGRGGAERPRSQGARSAPPRRAAPPAPHLPHLTLLAAAAAAAAAASSGPAGSDATRRRKRRGPRDRRRTERSEVGGARGRRRARSSRKHGWVGGRREGLPGISEKEDRRTRPRHSFPRSCACQRAPAYLAMVLYWTAQHQSPSQLGNYVY
ncbi:uncharacterized protein Dpagt1l1 [Rattus norvegicus]|uniref:uncharacterized protein Dpagt1l1 n=1 Tax=Rattus norvegicus TaxID=10116 RepID=UPI0019178E98|nr:uncharacterized protein LOC108352191 [Rattus norvegicus]